MRKLFNFLIIAFFAFLFLMFSLGLMKSCGKLMGNKKATTNSHTKTPDSENDTGKMVEVIEGTDGQYEIINDFSDTTDTKQNGLADGTLSLIHI